MADWPLRGDAQIYENAGGDESDSGGATATAPVATDTKGAYGQIVASTKYDAQGFVCLFAITNADNLPCLADIALGASGAEEIILPNFSFTTRNRGSVLGGYFPIPIPSGSRISFRVQTSTASSAVDCVVLLEQVSFMPSAPSARVEAWGIDETVSFGHLYDCGGTADTKGGYQEIIASTLFDVTELSITLGNADSFTRANATFLIDVAVGASGAEDRIITNYYSGHGSSSDMNFPPQLTVPCHIPAGSRVSVNAQCSSNTSSTRIFDIAFLGIG